MTKPPVTVWIMEPHDPLLVRDGRPFGPEPGARATSLPFPFPSTLAGGIRTRAGVDENGVFQYTRNDKAELQHLKELRVRGPLLVQLAAGNEETSPDNMWLLPAPRDASLFSAENTETGEPAVTIRRLVPLNLLPGAETDLDHPNLLYIGQSHTNAQKKPSPHAPAYWYWKHFQTWLLNPSAMDGESFPLSQLGLQGPEHERRLHVSIEADKETAKDGMLFETAGLEFTVPGIDKRRLQGAQRLALAVAVEDSEYTVRPGLASFGGERRLVTWRRSSEKLPTYPEGLEETILADGHCRLFLLTPACFKLGYYPTWLQKEATSYGIQLDVKAIVNQRPQVVSGWDLATNEPKPSRRLAPAGTVMFLSLKGPDADLKTWIRETWMQCISDDQQDRTDGFGMVVLGTWNGPSDALKRGTKQ